jgi:hypothetical protein
MNGTRRTSVESEPDGIDTVGLPALDVKRTIGPKMECPRCGSIEPERHRYCSACGLELSHGGIPGKVTRLFIGFPTQPTDVPEALLRVSRYPDAVLPQEDGMTRLVREHTRISIWEVDRPVGAISLTPEESERLAKFLSTQKPDERQTEDVGR